MFSLLVVVTLGLACLASVSAQSNGNYNVWVGGALKENNTAVFDTIIQYGGARGICVLTTASGDPYGGWLYYQDIFVNQFGYENTYWVNVNTTADANSEEAVATAKKCTGFFFGGGDQTRVTAALWTGEGEDRGFTQVLQVIFGSYENTVGLIAGTSAGAMVQPYNCIITGGVSYTALLYGAQIDSDEYDVLTYDPDGGINVGSYGYIDTHFSQRGREGRMIRMLADTQDVGQYRGSKIGYGVDENTALFAREDASGLSLLSVMGENGVTKFDVSQAHITDNGEGDWSITNVLVTYLTSGDLFSDQNGKVSIASYKSQITNAEYDNAIASKDIFNSPYADEEVDALQFQTTAWRLFDSEGPGYVVSSTFETNPQFFVNMTNVQDESAAYKGVDRDGITRYSYVNMRVDIFSQ